MEKINKASKDASFMAEGEAKLLNSENAAWASIYKTISDVVQKNSLMLEYYRGIASASSEVASANREILDFANENRSSMIDYIHKIIIEFVPNANWF